MQITPDPEFRKVMLDKIAQREFHERKGIHQSDLTYCLNKQALRRLDPRPITDSDLLLFSLGYMSQRWLTGQDNDMPEEEQDGITVTLDSTWENIPWELKATFTNSTKSVEENLPWLRQIMAQCYITGKTTAKLSRLEIMGNWKSIFGKKEEKDLPDNRKPTLSTWRLEFTVDELCRNWEWLLSRKRQFEEILSTGKLLPMAVAVPSGQQYECERCVYRGNSCTIS
jgi:hypothetical protein